ncbi:MAG TPA: amidase [Candidatus Binatia bacterium]|jgi:amidase|nr:amidase [Candidatus Binatia bacterium]
MSEITFRSAGALAQAIRQRTVSSRELLEHYLARVDRLNPALNAVVTIDAEGARAAADAADAALARRDTLGPLHGVPMTIKDAFETTAVRSTCGFHEWADHHPVEDAEAVARLRAAGVIIFGKTNVPVLAGDWQSYNPIFGVTNNPWDVTRTPGGSSGGAAAALAADLTPLELGSDIGGSIRVPSSWTGICGHKPSYGLVPSRGHLPPGPGSLAEPDLNVVGPLARCVDDLMRELDILAGPLPDRATAWTLRLPPPRRTALGDLRLACWFDDAAFPVDDSVRTVLEDMAGVLRRAGARIDDRARPAFALADAVRTFQQLLLPVVIGGFPRPQFDAFAGMAAGLSDDDDSPLARTARYGTMRHRDWMLTHEAREQLRARFAEFFTSFDALLCPVMVVPAIPHDHSEPFPARTITVNGQTRPYTDLFGWVGMATAAYLPATVVPVGRTASGLPVGVQIIGPYLEDRTPLAVATHIESLLGGFAIPPGYGS